MNWLRGLGISVKVAIGALLMTLAIMSANRSKDLADKWRHNAVEIENGYAIKGADTAAAANTHAKIHDEKAHRPQKPTAKSHMAGIMVELERLELSTF